MLGFTFLIFFCIQYCMLVDVQGENESKTWNVFGMVMLNWFYV